MAERKLNESYRQFRQWDMDAFTEIYEQLKRPVFMICWRILQSREEAEDITHDVFLKLYTRGQIEEIANLRAWIFQIAHNSAIDLYRRKSRAEQELISKNCESILEPVDMHMDLEMALSKLTPEEKSILAMKINTGLSFAEIAQVVGFSLPATYRKYRKALRFLKQELNGGNL